MSLKEITVGHEYDIKNNFTLFKYKLYWNVYLLQSCVPNNLLKFFGRGETRLILFCSLITIFNRRDEYHIFIYENIELIRGEVFITVVADQYLTHNRHARPFQDKKRRKTIKWKPCCIKKTVDTNISNYLCCSFWITIRISNVD